ncbi:hypothetical protein [Photobacterium damselae]|uniref:hypothetical protein n=1 Tax=Photobacterium damselae TaxID=38293 RepID=UPI001F1BDEAA|nr:hypothetical protein [Photobacterium damselae]UKA11865.1 hypothetical protein IHC91_18985 [Photobacterium damselae subsp. damselae]
MNKMTKSFIALAMASTFASPVFAASSWTAPAAGTTDATSASVEWTGGVPIVVSGGYTKLTGLNGGAIAQGELDVNMDGSFGSKAGSIGQVITELHKYDATNDVVEGLITSADKATGVTWSVISAPIVTSSGLTDTSTAKAVLKASSALGQTVMTTPVSGTADELNRVTWTINSDKGGLLTDVNQGDTISVTAIVQAETSF